MAFVRINLFRSLISTARDTCLLKRFYSNNTVNLSDPAIQTYLKHLIVEHEKLHMQTKRNADESKRLQEIKPVVHALEKRIALFDSIESLKELNKKDADSETKKMIKEEAEIYLTRLNEIDNELLSTLFEPQWTDGGVLLEVTAGAGGQESMLFAREIFNMYQGHAEYKGWDFDTASIEESDLGGIRKASMIVTGYGAPELLKMEAGVHRVQRIPTTEKGGRIHTSTVSVAVLPQPTDITLDIQERDVVVETKRASGAGGQHVNTTDSAVRLIHTPTNTVVECQEGRSQIKNKEIAMQKLKTLLLEKQIHEHTSQVNSQRKSQIGSSNRNEKIRTYNYPQDRVTEHREGGTTMHNLKGFLAGGEQLDELQENLLKTQHQQHIMNEINEFIKNYKVDAEN